MRDHCAITSDLGSHSMCHFTQLILAILKRDAIVYNAGPWPIYRTDSLQMMQICDFITLAISLPTTIIYKPCVRQAFINSIVFLLGGTFADIGDQSCTHLVIEENSVTELPNSITHTMKMVKQEVS